MAILHLRMLQKMDTVLNILLNPLQNILWHASAHGHSQLKHHKLGVGSYTE